MAQAFTRDPDDDARIIGFLEDVERSVVLELMHQTSVLLSDGSEDDASGASGTSGQEDIFASLSRSMEAREAPSDPALRRLLPDGVKGDDDAAGEFRRFTEASLREGKLANLDTAMRALERDFVDDEQSAAMADGVYDAARDPGAPAPNDVAPADTDTAQGRHDAPARADRQPGGAGDDATVADSDDELDGLNGLDDGAREVVVSEGEARAMMKALTDVRLVLAERLGLRTDEDAQALSEQLERGAMPSSPEELLAAYYDFLTWMSESLTLAVMRRS